MIEEGIKRHVDNAIRSLYQLIMAVDAADQECRMLDLNPELEHLGREHSDLIGFFNSMCVYVHPEDREAFMRFTDPEDLYDRLRRKIYISMECRIRHMDRSYFWSEIIICNSAYEDSAKGDDLLFLIHDIHERKSYELRKEAETRFMMLDLQGRYDALFIENMTDQQTGCFNRKGMKYYSDIVLREAKKSGRSLFVCVADLNGLKYLNDTYGHAAGDEAIAAVSSELLKAAPEGAKTVRTGGDEFLILGVIDEDSHATEEMGRMIDEGLRSYNSSHNNPYEIGVSYGWVIMPYKEGMVSLDEYIAIADEKMYEMKNKRDAHKR